MTVDRAALAWGATAVFAAIAATLFGGMDAPGASLALGGLGGISLLVVGFRVAGGFNNLLCVFLLFHLLYGLSGPINALYGEPLAALFSVPYETAVFLTSFSVATAALATALVLSASLSDVTSIERRPLAVDPGILGGLALLFAGAASVLELSNMVRVGLTSALQGKATYQSAVDALTFTAPSYELARIAFSLFALTVANQKLIRSTDGAFRSMRYGQLFFLLLSPLLLLSVFLGRRGPLLDWIFIFFIGSTWFVARRRIGRGVAVGMLAAYLLMGMLFANRATLAYSFYVGDFALFRDHVTQREVIVSGLNPGANEFGAAFGNFSEYVKYDVDGPQFGRTYLEGFGLVVPAFLYPGTKPQPVAFAFRDRFFPGVEAEGAIASTAYSSILEAYVNFRQVGVGIVYFLVGLALMALERRRRRSTSAVAALVYLAILPSAIVFHRADFGASVIGPIIFSLILIAMLAVVLAVLESLGRVRLTTPALETVSRDG